MKFLNDVVDHLLAGHSSLGELTVVLPGKRPIVFIKKSLAARNYNGLLPSFCTIEELMAQISRKIAISGVALWLFAFDVYDKSFGDESLASFLKWFPTVQKDFDDIVKFAPAGQNVLEYMVQEEQIKDWAKNLGDDANVPRTKFLNFWKKMYRFLPELQQKLEEEDYATSGMMQAAVRKDAEDYAAATKNQFVFCGFNAFTPAEEALVRALLQYGKAQTFFQADRYYMERENQESGQFLRQYKNWKEFNRSREFHFIYDDLAKAKNIRTYELSGNISQSKILPSILNELRDELSETAVVLLDENLLPATLDSLQEIPHLNITMGFPLKNLGFSNAVRQFFHLQKQLEKNSAYYYNDLFKIFDETPSDEHDTEIIKSFKLYVQKNNIVYISARLLAERLAALSYYHLLLPMQSGKQYLAAFTEFCYQLKFDVKDDVMYENISHFEKAFKTISNQLENYELTLTPEVLESLVHQMLNSEAIDFEGEPVQGLQVMGLLETRLLNFKNVILLSVNEGKLPLGNTQNTYIPFDIRKHFDMHTFLENDGIYAYHFYRLLQGAQNIHLLYNGLSSGANSSEKSRFIAQLEMESGQPIRHFVEENQAEPVSSRPLTIPKTPAVMDQLYQWKKRVSASHFANYLYDPIDFYLNNVLSLRSAEGVEEELSVMMYGTLVHEALQLIYQNFLGKKLSPELLKNALADVDSYLNLAIKKLNHRPEYYERGKNYIHYAIARKSLENILSYDLDLIREGNTLEILEIEKKFENIELNLREETGSIFLRGKIDRIDLLNGEVRIIDYKTGAASKLDLCPQKKPWDDETIAGCFLKKELLQALQLFIYSYAFLKTQPESAIIRAGIWSFQQIKSGVRHLEIGNTDLISFGDLQILLPAVQSLVSEILNPEIPFMERIEEYSDF